VEGIDYVPDNFSHRSSQDEARTQRVSPNGGTQAQRGSYVAQLNRAVAKALQKEVPGFDQRIGGASPCRT